MTSWVPLELAGIGTAEEIRISADRPGGGGLFAWTPIWVVLVENELYVRAGGGREAGWYRHATSGQAHIQVLGVQRQVTLELRTESELQDAVDQAYRTKYASCSSLHFLVSDAARTTTSRLIPVR